METKTKKLTTLGKIVEWMDSVFVSRKTAVLVFLVFTMGIIVSKQSANWNFFENAKAAALEDSGLPVFSPGKNILADSGMRCGQKQEESIDGISSEYSLEQFFFKKNAGQIIQNKPMQEMLEAVSKRDIQTASYLVAIAKKESNLGKFSPKKNGRNCYNYWGYRGKENTTNSGYSCFDSPEHAVAVVGDRIQALSQIGKRDTPQKMAVWKCGYDCSWDNPANVKKWIADVELYYNKLNL